MYTNKKPVLSFHSAYSTVPENPRTGIRLMQSSRAARPGRVTLPDRLHIFSAFFTAIRAMRRENIHHRLLFRLASPFRPACMNSKNRSQSLFPRAALLFGITLLPVFGLAQTLFTFGKHAVNRETFLKAYQKSRENGNEQALSYEEYLDLYRKFRMKLQAAIDSGMDTLPEQKMEREAFRAQLADNFIREDAAILVMAEEAAARSLKDIRLSHLSIPVTPGAGADEIAAAEREVNAAYEALKQGKSFHSVASPYNDPQMGFITVFVLPYAVENIAYSLPVGSFSQPFRSELGFHILKKEEERPALGSIRVAQILVAFPPDMTDETKIQLREKADSLYRALQEGADFADLARRFSDDNHSYQSGGEMPEFGVGTYDRAFEEAAFALKEDGDISTPVETSFGYHLLRRLQRIPVTTDAGNKEWLAFLKEKVTQSDRMTVARAQLLNNIRNTIQKDAPQEVLATDTGVMRYYRDHLERYNPEFAEQLQEFRDGNLLFGIMLEKVWDAAANDSAGLKQYFDAHRERYTWENSADALVFTCADDDTVEKIQGLITTGTTSWRNWADQLKGLIQADSGRFEVSQIPLPENTTLAEGMTTPPFVSEQDQSRTFAYIVRLYPGKELKSFADARGAVISNYQDQLEKQWIDELSQTYPFKLNKKTFRKLPRVGG